MKSARQISTTVAGVASSSTREDSLFLQSAGGDSSSRRGRGVSKSKSSSSNCQIDEGIFCGLASFSDIEAKFQSIVEAQGHGHQSVATSSSRHYDNQKQLAPADSRRRITPRVTFNINLESASYDENPSCSSSSNNGQAVILEHSINSSRSGGGGILHRSKSPRSVASKPSTIAKVVEQAAAAAAATASQAMRKIHHFAGGGGRETPCGLKLPSKQQILKNQSAVTSRAGGSRRQRISGGDGTSDNSLNSRFLSCLDEVVQVKPPSLRVVRCSSIPTLHSSSNISSSPTIQLSSKRSLIASAADALRVVSTTAGEGASEQPQQTFSMMIEQEKKKKKQLRLLDSEKTPRDASTHAHHMRPELVIQLQHSNFIIDSHRGPRSSTINVAPSPRKSPSTTSDGHLLSSPRARLQRRILSFIGDAAASSAAQGSSPRSHSMATTPSGRSISQLSRGRCIQIYRQNLEAFGKTSSSSSSSSSRFPGTSHLNARALDCLATFLFDVVGLSEYSSGKAKQEWNVPVPSIYKLFTQFNVDQAHFTSLLSSEEKEAYLIECVQRQTQHQLEELVGRISARTAIAVQQEEQQSKQRHSGSASIGEQFSWINIDCKYTALKQKVQHALIEVLYNEGKIEQLSALNSTAKLAQEKAFFSSYLSANSKASTTASVSYAPNRQPLSEATNAFRKNNEIILLLDEETGPPQPPLSHSVTDQIRLRQQQLSVAMAVTPSLSSPPDETDGTTQLQQATLERRLNSLSWTNESERTFQSYQENRSAPPHQSQHSSSKQSHHARVSALHRFISQLGLEEKLDVYREQLLVRFQQDHQPLNHAEKMFLINTSSLLNSAIDRQEFQELLSFIKQEDIDQLELKIADNSLSRYSTISSQLKVLRTDYLAKHAWEQAYRNRKNALNELAKRQAVSELHARRRRRKSEKAYFIRFLKDRNQIIHYHLSLRANPFVQHFVRQLKKAIVNKLYERHPLMLLRNDDDGQARRHRQFIHRNIRLRPDKLLFPVRQEGGGGGGGGGSKVLLSLSQTQKLFHPPSQILMNLGKVKDSEEAKKRGQNMIMNSQDIKRLTLLASQQKSLSKSLLGLKSPPHNNGGGSSTQATFVKYLSSGPTKERFAADWANTSDVRVSAAVIIQKFVRLLCEQKQFKKRLSAKREEEEKKMFLLLKKWKESKELIAFIRKETREKLRAKQNYSSARHLMNVVSVTAREQKKKQEEEEEEGRTSPKTSKLTRFQDNATAATITIKPLFSLSSSFIAIDEKSQRAKKTDSEEYPSSPFDAIAEKPPATPVAAAAYRRSSASPKRRGSSTPNRSGSNGNQFLRRSNSITNAERMKQQQQLLLKNSEDLQLKQRKLFLAAKSGNLPILLTYGFVYYSQDVNVLDDKHLCPLLYVTRRGDKKFITFLLSRGADVNFKCLNDITPLHIAFEKADATVILNFMNHRGDLNTLTDEGLTPLAFAPFKLIQQLGLQGGVTHKEGYRKDDSAGEGPSNQRRNKRAKILQFDNNELFNNVHVGQKKPQPPPPSSNAPDINQHTINPHHQHNNSRKESIDSLFETHADVQQTLAGIPKRP